jgi:hypothetical protein
VDCTTLAITSPLGAVQKAALPFYWDGAAGATSYQVSLYNMNGQRVQFAETSNTNAVMSVHAAGEVGQTFSWDVIALVDGQPACVASSGPVEILSPGVQPTSEPREERPFTASWACSGSYQAKVSFKNAPGATVTISYRHDGTPDTIVASGPNGTVTLMSGYSYTNGSVSSGGKSVGLGGSLTCP